MVDDLVDPGEQEMRLEIVPFGEFSALGRLELLHGTAVPPRLLGGERVDRVDEAVAVVALDLRLGQLLAHGRHPTPQRVGRDHVALSNAAPTRRVHSRDFPDGTLTTP